jgi:hypothetical protein
MTGPTPSPAPIYVPLDADPELQKDWMIIRFDEANWHLSDDRDYYLSKRRPEAIGIAVPKEMEKLLAHVGYPRLYVDAISERLQIEGFRLGSQTDADEDLWDWWQANNLDVQAPLGFTDALVYGRSYITVSAPDPDDPTADPKVPVICVEPPSRLWADIDPRTRKVIRAIRVVRDYRPGYPHQVIAATLYLPNETYYWTVQAIGGLKLTDHVVHDIGVVPVIPMLNQTSLADLNGTSQITPEIRAVTDAAARILMDMQGAAELMAIPQRLLFGVNPQDIGVDPTTGNSQYDAYMARILAFADPEGSATQFAAAELQNFVSALDQLDKKAAAYTGLPPQYLSVQSDNPASAEAIKASESRLVMHCERKATLYGGAWEDAMRVAYLVMNPGKIPPDYLRLESIWQDPSTPTYAAKADAATKLYANGMGVIPREQARIDMGYTVEQRLEMKEWDKEESPAIQLAGMMNPSSQPSSGGSKSAASPTETVDKSPLS